ncbi:hypothetical protein [Bradyrhizobium prioriisuperbiae]|uniref:hypothetical protein n=1 Tax=Bradyrhizobium prioriisuperbiae TaxID=2854389 RepID=UPI0028EF359B|nr:hypothetical protein [Bradyrhizobium prioritasuperba]
MAHAHSHHDHSHDHGHHHAPHAHPPQPAPWSILRMGVLPRLGVALAASALLWAVVLLAMR